MITPDEIQAEAVAQFRKRMPLSGNPAIDLLAEAAFKAGFAAGGEMAMAMAVAMIEADRTMIRIKKESKA